MPNCELRQTSNTETSVPQPKNKSTVVQENGLIHKLKCEPQFWQRQYDATHRYQNISFTNEQTANHFWYLHLPLCELSWTEVKNQPEHSADVSYWDHLGTDQKTLSTGENYA